MFVQIRAVRFVIERSSWCHVGVKQTKKNDNWEILHGKQQHTRVINVWAGTVSLLKCKKKYTRDDNAKHVFDHLNDYKRKFKCWYTFSVFNEFC